MHKMNALAIQQSHNLAKQLSARKKKKIVYKILLKETNATNTNHYVFAKIVNIIFYTLFSTRLSFST